MGVLPNSRVVVGPINADQTDGTLRRMTEIRHFTSLLRKWDSLKRFCHKCTNVVLYVVKKSPRNLFLSPCGTVRSPGNAISWVYFLVTA